MKQMEKIVSNATLTTSEFTVLNAIAEHCYDDFSSGAKQIANDLGISIKQAKGFIGSLVKKGYVAVDQESRGGKNFNDAFIIVDGESIGFGCDKFDSLAEMIEKAVS